MNETDPLMKHITEALETAPHVWVPDDFAARVMARVPQAKRKRFAMPAVQSPNYGRVSTIAAMVMLLAAILFLAPLTRNSSIWYLLQALLLTQLGALVLWFGWLRSRA